MEEWDDVARVVSHYTIPMSDPRRTLSQKADVEHPIAV